MSLKFVEKVNYFRSQPDAVLEGAYGAWFSAQSWAHVFGLSLEEAIEELRSYEALNLVSVWSSEYDCCYVGGRPDDGVEVQAFIAAHDAMR